MRVTTPLGDSGTLSLEEGNYLFGYSGQAESAAAVSLLMPVRSKQYESRELHPVFQMNLPEGFMLEELRNRLAKTLQLDPMVLLAISGSQAPVGRIRVDPSEVLRGVIQRQEARGERLTEIMEWDGKENIFAELVDKYITRAGISGVQPKVLVPEAQDFATGAESRATIPTADLIVKSGRQQFPGLAANEFLCMTMAKEAGIPVPEFYLSKNKELFVMRRFDRTPQGTPIGFEDMAALAGLSSSQKYSKSYSFVANLVTLFASPSHVTASLRTLFDIVALSCMVGNGDAHLKNFGLLYTDPTTEDCTIAPAYDIVNTTAYIPEDVLALELRGQKSFFSTREGLLKFAGECRVHDPSSRIQELILTVDMVVRRQEEIASTIPHVVRAIRGHLESFERTFLG
ncbi:MAG: type II toxin-antitoxin system HipA family toxin [Hylemonella sp.]|nr:type II toxin-antitoxin system HipA family toxin [Hylemonella sp.]MDP1935707.1 type II toxin-antitoxin system HipA family toxin [Hylemonella sp.]